MIRRVPKGTIALGVLFVLLLGLMVGCAGRRSYSELPMREAWGKIQNLYENEKYLDAIDRLELFLINYGGTAVSDSAQFLLAQSHFHLKEYIIAASEFQKLVIQYPESPLAEKGEYRMGLSYYQLSPKFSLDQEYTQKAAEAFQIFIEDYPESDLVDDATEMIDKCRNKLAHKEFGSGLLYQKMGEYTAARLYYDQVLNNYYDTEYAPRAQFRKAQSYEKQEQYREAILAYTAFLDRFEDHALANRALEGLNASREKLRQQQLEEDEPGFFEKLLGGDQTASAGN